VAMDRDVRAFTLRWSWQTLSFGAIIIICCFSQRKQRRWAYFTVMANVGAAGESHRACNYSGAMFNGPREGTPKIPLGGQGVMQGSPHMLTTCRDAPAQATHQHLCEKVLFV